MSKVSYSPKLGMEIEANWPQFERLPEELRAFSSTRYENFKCVHGNRRDISANDCQFTQLVPDKFKFPVGWFKSTDSGIEMKFDGPAAALAAAEKLVSDGSRWLNDFGFTAFGGNGTHVHVGHVAWLEHEFGTNALDLIYKRAEALMTAFFVSRERALWRLAPAHRVSTSWCNPYLHNPKPMNIIRTLVDPNTGLTCATVRPEIPSWALHNHVLTKANWPKFGLSGVGFIEVRRKSLPTLEFRMWAGTKNKTALLGYLHLVHTLFRYATTLFTEDNLRACVDGRDSGIVATPSTYSIDDLKRECAEDSWLVKWIDKTAASEGEPISCEITLDDPIQNLPQAVAAGV